MADQPFRKRRRADARIALELVSAAFDTTRPLVTNLIITRRCNLSCGYCFEYDKVSPPIPAAVLRDRIDHLARLRSVFVTLTGGESLLHPEADALVAYVRARHDAVPQHQRLPAHRGLDRAPRPRGAVRDADQRRPRRAERDVEEVAAHHASRLDRFRRQPLAPLALPAPEPPLVQLRPHRTA